MPSKNHISSFIEDLKNIREPDEANIEVLIESHYKGLTGDEKTPGSKLMRVIKHILESKLTDKKILEYLPVLLKGLKAVFPNFNTLKSNLVIIRQRYIKPNYSDEIYTKSTYDQYFNIERAKRDRAKKEYMKSIVDKNKNKIQLNIKDIFDAVDGSLKSINPYDKAVALIICSGCRPIELFVKNQFSLISDKPGWVKVDNLAKKRESQEIHSTERPIVILKAERFIKMVDDLRETMKPYKLLSDETGGLSANINTMLNKSVVKLFPFVKNQGIHNKSSFLRKVYADLSYDMFADKKRMNYNLWVSQVLGHDKDSITTSFSYSYVNIAKATKPIIKRLVESAREIDEENKNKPLEMKRAPKITKAEKLAKLNELYEANPKISNAQLRSDSGVGSRIVNEFLKNKRAEREENEG